MGQDLGVTETITVFRAPWVGVSYMHGPLYTTLIILLLGLLLVVARFFDFGVEYGLVGLPGLNRANPA